MSCPSRESIQRFARGAADAAECAAIARHLSTCAACAGLAEQVGGRPVPPGAALTPAADRSSDSLDAASTIGSPDAAAAPGALPPDAFPGYEVIGELHRGGQGIVYQAIQKSTKRRVALKVLRAGPRATQADRVRFEREIEVLGQLRHPNIVAVHDSGLVRDCYYFAMDYISGEPLDAWAARAPRPVPELLRLFQHICEAVDAAHRRGIVHRDLKPANIRVDEDGAPHILDFGLAKLAQGAETASGMTLTGQFMGSLPWASPEQAEARPGKIDARTDVYALGVVLYQLLTGRFPYDVTGTVRQVLERIITSPPARPTSGGRPLEADVETVVLKCLAKERERRYSTAGALAEDIGRYLRGEPIEARRDSALYVARTHARRGLRRHPLAGVAGGLVLVALATQHVVAPLVYRWTPLQRWYEGLLAGLPAPNAGNLDHVRVIGLTDRTDVARLAAAAGLADVDPANRPSLRRLHGALLERLAPSGLRAVVCDIAFPAASEFDADLARGMRALRAAGADVAVSMLSWSVGETGPPAVAPLILPEVKWGAATADFSAARPWSLDLLVERRSNEPAASLALLGVACYRQPGAEPYLVVDPKRQLVVLRYWKPQPDAPRVKHWLGSTDVVRLTGRWPLPADDEEHGLQAGDLVGHFFITVPSEEMLGRHTLEYAEVFEADAAQLRDWLAGRVVLLADLRGGVDRHPHPDGREVPGVYGHAAGIEAILQSLAITTPTRPQTWALIGSAMAVGGVIGVWLHRRIALCAAVLALGAAAAVGGAVAAYTSSRYLFNPLVPVFALLATGALAAYARRLAGAWRLDREYEETHT